jgi:hypothetical protein
MLRSLKSVLGFAATTAYNYIGELDDFLFDDQSWSVAYGVVDVGDWLLGRKALISPSAFEQVSRESHALRIGLSRQEIESSPDLDDCMPVSRQHRIALEGFFGWSGALAAEGISPRPFVPAPIPVAERTALKQLAAHLDPHLRSAREVLKYHIETPDGDIGRLDDFLVDDEQWEIVSLVVDTRKWLSGTRLLVSPNRARDISWQTRKVLLETSLGPGSRVLDQGPQV